MATGIKVPVTHVINRAQFFQSVRASLFNGVLKQSQVNALNGILDEWEAKYDNEDDRYLAYMLATNFHETATTMQPIAEYGKGKGRPYGVPDPVTKQVYYGRGFVQLTWKANYDKFGKLLGIDLLNNPDLALGLKTATDIMFIGMLQGLFTGKKLADYFSATKQDWVNARRIINGTDRAQLIAGYGQKFYEAIAYVPAVATTA